jgi:hypothetical protein
VSTFLLLNSQWAPFLLYSQTPLLHQPFSSPVQAATFSGVMLLLGSGAALAQNRPKLLYVLVPAFVLAIGQAGSRSGMVLLVLSWSAFVALYVGRQCLVDRKLPRSAYHIVASVLVAVAAISALRSTEMSRSLAFLGVQPRVIATGASDAYRSRVWREVIEARREDGAAATGASTGLAAPVATGIPSPPSTSTGSDSPAGPPPPREAPHSLYLEFLLYGGLGSMTALIGVLLLVWGAAVRHAWKTLWSDAFPLACALAFAVLFVAGINYGNVTLHLTFVWVLFGFVTASTSLPLIAPGIPSTKTYSHCL